MSFRSFLYRLASFLGDIQAIQKGPKAIVKRAIRKQATKTASSGINRFLS